MTNNFTFYYTYFNNDTDTYLLYESLLDNLKIYVKKSFLQTNLLDINNINYNYLSNTSFFKYFIIFYNKFPIVFDLSDMKHKSLRSLNDYYNNTLPDKQKIFFINNISYKFIDHNILISINLNNNKLINISLCTNDDPCIKNHIIFNINNDLYDFVCNFNVDPACMFNLKIIPMLEKSNKILDFSLITNKN